MNEISTPANSAVSIIQQAIQTGADPAYLKELLAVRREWEADEARKAYAQAMAACHREMPNTIRTDSRNSHTGSNYAKHDTVTRAIKPIYIKHGFSVSFGEEPCDREGFILVVATVRHQDGHAEIYRRFAPIDNLGPKGNAVKSILHGCQSSMSYMQRKLLESIFGIAESDDDDDGLAAGTQYVTKEQADELLALLDTLKDRESALAAMLEFGECDSVSDLPAAKFIPCKKALLTKPKK